MKDSAADLTATALLDEIADIGRDAVRGGYSRHVFDEADLALRAWFVDRAEGLGLQIERDRNANIWAWWTPVGSESQPAIATGSHLDSVPGGGAFDGPLGVVSALAAVGRLQAAGFVPVRPIAVVVFAEEEGARFGRACLGSQLLTGALAPDAARALTDQGGTRFETLLADNGVDPSTIGPDPDRVSRLAALVELHVEQGAQLAPQGATLGLATTILAHGRWRVTIDGRGDHAGSTELASRHDPMLVLAALVRAARSCALDAEPESRSRATVGRLTVVPGGTNAIASRVTAWLDARADEDADVRTLVSAVTAAVGGAARAEGCTVAVEQESFSPRVAFDVPLTDRIDALLGGVPRIPTGAGHDAGILSAVLPTAMLFVRNPDGVSHAPGESASADDCEAGVDALERVLRDLTSEPSA